MPEVTEEIQSTRSAPQTSAGGGAARPSSTKTTRCSSSNKPAGVVVHPTYKNTSGTLLNAVLWRVRDRADAQPGILTRLDKDTSGLVVIALTPDGARRDAERRCRRPNDASSTWRSSADRPSRRRDRSRCRSRETRRSAARRRHARRCAVRDALRGRCPPVVSTRSSAASCVTGRTHQIRVHLAAARLADRRRPRLRRARHAHRAPGAACLARLAAASDHAAAARIRSAGARRHARTDACWLWALGSRNVELKDLRPKA